jgi:hypothetical protein
MISQENATIKGSTERASDASPRKSLSFCHLFFVKILLMSKVDSFDAVQHCRMYLRIVSMSQEVLSKEHCTIDPIPEALCHLLGSSAWRRTSRMVMESSFSGLLASK